MLEKSCPRLMGGMGLVKLLGNLASYPRMLSHVSTLLLFHTVRANLRNLVAQPTKLVESWAFPLLFR